MFRLILLVTAASLLVALPLLAIPSAAEQGGQQSEAKSLFSVVSHRRVRVRLAQQPDPPADAAPAPSAAAPSASDDAAAAHEPAPAPADEPAPGLVDEPLPAEADAAVESEPTSPPAEEEQAEEEDPFEDEASATAPAVVPDICGPVRARIDDVTEEPGPIQSQKSDRPATKEDLGPIRAQINDVQQKAQKARSCNVCQRGGTHGKSVKGGTGGKHEGGSVKGNGPRFRGRVISSAHGGHGILAGGRGNGRAAGGRCAGGAGGRCGGGCGTGILGALTGGEGFCCCQMYQHYAYYPALHGHYYFRPYNHSQIPEQQRIAAEWGEDPRHPYANDLFQIVYADYIREQQAASEPAVEVPPPVDPTPPPVEREQN